MNQLCMVGRLQEINKKKGYVILKQTSNFKNSEGVYEEYTNKISINGNLLENLVDYCKENDIIGVRGRIENNIIIAEKISFLTTKKPEEN